jgi:cytochrome c biogenesis protein CcdA
VQHLLAIVIGVGLVDSANPSTIVPALYIAAGGHAVKGLAGFIAGVFVTNLVAGVLIALGPGEAIMAAVPHPGDHARHLIEISAGGFALVVAAVLWFQRERVAHHVTTSADRFDRSSFLVGAGIILVELPTAIPYFAVIATVVGSNRSAATQVLLLAVFNLCFVLPLAAIFGLRTLAGERSLGFLTRIRGSVDRFLATLAPALVAIVGLLLIGVGVYGILREGSH